jgi:hypothetical protein
MISIDCTISEISIYAREEIFSLIAFGIPAGGGSPRLVTSNASRMALSIF